MKPRQEPARPSSPTITADFLLAHWGAMTTLLLLASCLLIAPLAKAQGERVVPDVRFQPQDVVEIVVDSLQSNNEANDDGIATVFEFASPKNRVNTGPLARFTQMIKRGFPDMLNHDGARYDPLEVTGDTAVQAVWLLTSSGAEVGYAFQLGKQQSGTYKDMWMTEAVVPLGESARSGTRI